MPVYSSILTPSQLSRREELSTNIRLYQGTRAARCRMQAELEELGQRRNLPLPPELMGLIFNFYVHVYDQLPERLLLVCRAWHVLALSQRALWTNLDPLSQFGLTVVRPWAGTFLQSRIARSNPAPLKIGSLMCSWNIISQDMEKIANIETFRSRIQDLTITNRHDLVYLINDQQLLKRLCEYPVLGEYLTLEEPIANAVKCKLSEKTITTLRFKCQESLELPIWPESLLRRIQTLEVPLRNSLRALHAFLAIVQKSTALLTLHIVTTRDSISSLSHASCRNLTVTYYYRHCSLGEVRMPCLQELTIVAWASIGLLQLTLVDTSISSLRLECNFATLYENLDPAIRVSWINDAILLLRSAPRLKRFSISAPSGLVAGLSEAFADDPSLCIELDTFIIDGPTEIELDVRGRILKKVDAKFEQLRSDVAASVDQRRLRRSKN